MATARPSAFGDDFGQKIDLTARIREILVNYPPGTTILKEFLQNADDAGAGVVKFCVDERSFGSKSLAHEKLAAFQGPSFLVYNSGVFSDEDFDSIQSIGDSKKRGQLAKTGRFGIGFNSCYHLTELPTFLSRSFLVMFDPQAKYLPDVNPANPGKRIDILSPMVQEHFADQIAPYAAFGSDLKSEFKGTLFRLPLRTAEQGATSRLSTKMHNTDELVKLVRDFLEEAQQSLLFLKNVSHIEALHWRAGSDAPTSLWTCKIANPSKALSEARSMVPTAVAHSQRTALQERKLGFKHTESDYELAVAISCCMPPAGSGEERATDISINSHSYVHRWLVSVTHVETRRRPPHPNLLLTLHLSLLLLTLLTLLVYLRAQVASERHMRRLVVSCRKNRM
jgi:sacsin